MKANELRIGNWVKRSTQPDGFKIDSHSFIVCERDPSMYEPIPLTEEWLVKFGLTDKNESDIGTAFYFPHRANRHWLNEHLQISVFHSKFNHKDDEYFNMMLAEIHLGDFEYVHQLQNLYFALTGEEL